MPTISVENYLKALYSLGQRTEGSVKTKAIAQKLEISLPSVTSMLQSLAEEGLVDYKRYHGATLTEAGEKLALAVIRKHRLVELFLVQTLEYTWDEVHAEAERLEHAISDELAARIERYLSFPQFDPHGDPIPNAHGELPSRDSTVLDAAPQKTPLTLLRVMDQDSELLRYLKRIGLTPRTSFEIEEVLPFDGQMFLKFADGRQASISRALASLLLVKVMA